MKQSFLLYKSSDNISLVLNYFKSSLILIDIKPCKNSSHIFVFNSLKNVRKNHRIRVTIMHRIIATRSFTKQVFSIIFYTSDRQPLGTGLWKTIFPLKLGRRSAQPKSFTRTFTVKFKLYENLGWSSGSDASAGERLHVQTKLHLSLTSSCASPFLTCHGLVLIVVQGGCRLRPQGVIIIAGRKLTERNTNK